MNVADGLEEHMNPIAAANGVTLSIEERLKLETTLDQLNADIKCDEMLFHSHYLSPEKHLITFDICV